MSKAIARIPIKVTIEQNLEMSTKDKLGCVYLKESYAFFKPNSSGSEITIIQDNIHYKVHALDIAKALKESGRIK